MTTIMKSLLGLLFLLLIPVWGSATEPWRFAVIADNRMKNERSPGTYEGVLNQIKNLATESSEGGIEVVVGAGDINLSADGGHNWKLWQDTFKGHGDIPAYVPVIGNHESKADLPIIHNVVLPSQLKGATDVRKPGVNYYVDTMNVRLIVLDQYNPPFGVKAGCVNAEGRKWAGQIIDRAPESIEHVFVAFHEPAFPRGHHVGRSFDADIKLRNDFWDMLMARKKRIRAVFVGHTHRYSRICVADPRSAEANNPKKFPVQEGGIWQIDAGNAGRGSHSNYKSTIVLVTIRDDEVFFKILQAFHNAPGDFTVSDEWKIEKTQR